MHDSTRPFLVVYVAWHPDFSQGAQIAEALREHFRRKHFENVAGGAGLSVIFRSASAPGNNIPSVIDFHEANTTAVVVLMESSLAKDLPWINYVKQLEDDAEAAGLGSHVFPVALDGSGVMQKFSSQALRWDQWRGAMLQLQQRLIRELAYQFCRMLRHYLEHLKRPAEEEEALEAYLKKVQIFLSHSKHDTEGVAIANRIRGRLHGGKGGTGFASFFDVHDIPPGLRFQRVLLLQVKLSAVVAIHTDSYSSREWCRREIIEAKRWNVPLVVANCISYMDERGFPYMGNVPVVRLSPRGVDRIDFVIGRLLDEVLKDFLWRCRIELIGSSVRSGVRFIPRPPELISLAGLPPESDEPCPVLVYPDPPLSAEEERLFEEVAPRVRLRSLTEWLAGARP